MRRLEGRVALVTGGASGIGAAIARRLKSEGANVAISDVNEDLGRRFASENGLAFFLQDVTDEAGWPRIFNDIKANLGPVQILVNNAGMLGVRKNADPAHAQLHDWRQVFAVNVESVFLGCRAAIDAMQSSGGAIVNISSVAGLRATPKATAYAASKAAVRNLTVSVAQYCAEAGLKIRCNSVHPGDVRTPLWESFVRETAAGRGIEFEEQLRIVEADIPLGDLTRPEDVAAAVAFLASDDARHMTGAMMIVDGGTVDCPGFVGIGTGPDTGTYE